MDDNTTGLLITSVVFGSIVLICWLGLRHRAGGALTRAGRAQLEDMGQVAAALEARVNTLERILDDQVPAWRAGDYQAGPVGYGVRR